jgi:hypothetical protein
MSRASYLHPTVGEELDLEEREVIWCRHCQVNRYRAQRDIDVGSYDSLDLHRRHRLL